MTSHSAERRCTCDHRTTALLDRQGTSRRATAFRLAEITHRLRREGRFFAEFGRQSAEKRDPVTLARIRGRVEAVAHLMSAATKELKLLGIDKKAPFLQVDGKEISLQEALRRLRAIQASLKDAQAKYVLTDAITALIGSVRLGHGVDEAGSGEPGGAGEIGGVRPAGAVIGAVVVAIGSLLVAIFRGAFNGTEDDETRKLVGQKSPSDLERMPDDTLIQMINTLLDGPTGDDDEEAILKILRSVADCGRITRITRRVGVNRLLDDIDGDEWDQLVVLLERCGILNFSTFDDDASRLFINERSCAQLGQLNVDSIHRLVLNMFAGSCGDDDEDAILKLLSCQSTAKLQQLVAMPGTGVDDFDYNFDGDQWDDLEAFFAVHGITLDD